MDAEVPREVEHLLGQIEREPGYRGCVLVGLQPVERPGTMSPPVHPLGERVGVPR